MPWKSLNKWVLTAGLVLPGMLFQQGCAIDPDIWLRAFLQVFSEVAIFALDNATLGLQ
jgi:hypothetical protein